MRCSVAATALFLDPRVEEGLVFIVVHRLRRGCSVLRSRRDPPRREPAIGGKKRDKPQTLLPTEQMVHYTLVSNFMKQRTTRNKGRIMNNT